MLQLKSDCQGKACDSVSLGPSGNIVPQLPRIHRAMAFPTRHLGQRVLVRT